MLIIGFAPNTTKKLPRIFCRAPLHCAPIIYRGGGKYLMYQFVRRGYITPIALNNRAIKLLGANGWHFILLNATLPHDFMWRTAHLHSCVAVCKCAIGLRTPFIQTPRALYKLVNRIAYLRVIFLI